jgi:hypothetical protein
MFLMMNSNEPIVVKYSDRVSYLPLFRTEAMAQSAIDELKPEVAAKFYFQAFSFDQFDRCNERAKAAGVMLFLYPVVEAEAKAKSEFRARQI